MDPLVPARRDGWIDRPRTVGTPRHWAKHGSLLGALLGWLVPASIVTGLLATSGDGWIVLAVGLLHPFNVLSALVGGLAGGLLGVAHPALLDEARHRVPVLGIAAGQTVTGAIAGAAAGGAWSLPLLVLDPSMSMIAITAALGAVVGALVAPIWWLPFTVATVTGRQWPVTLAVAAGVPALLALVCTGLGATF